MKMRLMIATLLFSSAVFAADPIVGTWKLNVEKSQMRNPVQSETMSVAEIAPNTYHAVIDVVTSKGDKRHQEFNRIADGKEHPVEGVGVPPGDTEVVSTDNRTVTRYRNGKRLGETEVWFSPDGKTHTVTQTGVDAKGSAFKDVSVWERQ